MRFPTYLSKAVGSLMMALRRERYPVELSFAMRRIVDGEECAIAMLKHQACKSVISCSWPTTALSVSCVRCPELHHTEFQDRHYYRNRRFQERLVDDARLTILSVDYPVRDACGFASSCEVSPLLVAQEITSNMIS